MVGHAHWSDVKFEILPAIAAPRIIEFRVLPGSQQSYQITNIVRGVYYRVESSSDLINWEFKTGIRPSDYGNLKLTDNSVKPRLFYRVQIK